MPDAAVAEPRGRNDSGQAYSESTSSRRVRAPDDCPEMEFVPYEYYSRWSPGR